MKLRTRLALLAGAVILLASLLCDGVVYRVCKRTLIDKAAAQGYREAVGSFLAFEQFSAGREGQMDASQAVYFLKSRKEAHAVLLENGEPVYNQTVIDPAALGDQWSSWDQDSGAQSQQLFVEGRRVVAFSFPGWAQPRFQLLYFCDITDAYISAYRLAGEVLVLSLAIVSLAILAFFLILRRALRPLQALSEGAQAIAAGAYGQRVPAGRKDEIGELGRDFNKMAGAVESHIREVEESEEKKTLFMGSLTHELKTPLTAISGYAQTLRMAKLTEEDKETALGYIYEESQRLDRLSRKMLRLMELEQETGLDSGPVPIRALFQGAAAVCAPAAGTKGVGLAIGDCQGELAGDKDLLTEAVVNLVDNAIKASSPGQDVQMYTEDGALVVEDAGCGIPPKDLGNLTEPFYMVDKSRSRKGGGAGMGLALTAVILRRHGLALHFDSHPGAGTKVSVFTI